MRNKGNGFRGNSGFRDNRRTNVNPQEELRRLRAICSHPDVKATIIQVISTTPQETWRDVFTNLSYQQGREVVASIASEEALTALALLPFQLGGKDVLRGISDRNTIPEVSLETKVSSESLNTLANTMDAIGKVRSSAARQ